MAATVIVINTFRNALASGVDCDQHYRAFETHVSKLLSRALSASQSEPVVLVASNTGMALARSFNIKDLHNRPDLSQVSVTPEPTPRPYEGPACLHVLAAALGILDTVLPPTAAAARVLFITPWHSSQDDANDGENWTSVLEEISSCMDRSGGGGTERVKSCDFVLIEMQSDCGLERSCLARLSAFIDEVKAEGAASEVTLPLVVQAAALSDDSFSDLFRRVLGWEFQPRAVTLTIDAGVAAASARAAIPAVAAITLHCELRPAVWTANPWWHGGLGGLRATGLVPLARIDAIRLSGGAVFALTPSRGKGGPSSMASGRQLPRGALRENRSMFAAVCAHLSRNDLGLVMRCPAVQQRGNDLGPDEVWLLHCDPASNSQSAETLCHQSAWESAILQQLMPPEIVLAPPGHEGARCPLDDDEASRAEELAVSIIETLDILGAMCSNPDQVPHSGAFSTPGLFDRPSGLHLIPSSGGVETFTSPWLHQHRARGAFLGPDKSSALPGQVHQQHSQRIQAPQQYQQHQQKHQQQQHRVRFQDGAASVNVSTPRAAPLVLSQKPPPPRSDETHRADDSKFHTPARPAPSRPPQHAQHVPQPAPQNLNKDASDPRSILHRKQPPSAPIHASSPPRKYQAVASVSSFDYDDQNDDDVEFIESTPSAHFASPPPPPPPSSSSSVGSRGVNGGGSVRPLVAPLLMSSSQGWGSQAQHQWGARPGVAAISTNSKAKLPFSFGKG